MRILPAILAALTALIFAGCGSTAVPESTPVVTVIDATDVTGVTFGNNVVSLATVRAAAPHATVSVVDLQQGTAKRAYVVVAPTTGTSGLPVLLVLHGVNASPTTELVRDEFLPLATAGKAVLVYPAAYKRVWNTVLDDTTFVNAVVADVRRDLDTGITDLVGFSDGGKMAFTLLCAEPTAFSAAAVVSATPVNTCATAPVVPLAVGVGTLDPAISVASVRALVAGWATGPVTTGTVGKATITRQGRFETIVWTGGLHTWERSPEFGVAASAGTLVWAFLSAQ